METSPAPGMFFSNLVNFKKFSLLPLLPPNRYRKLVVFSHWISSTQPTPSTRNFRAAAWVANWYFTAIRHDGQLQISGGAWDDRRYHGAPQQPTMLLEGFYGQYWLITWFFRLPKPLFLFFWGGLGAHGIYTMYIWNSKQELFNGCLVISTHFHHKDLETSNWNNHLSVDVSGSRYAWHISLLLYI